MTPDTTDAFVYQDEYVNFLDKKYPGAFAATTNPIFLSLDNEVDLWAFTHARLRGDAVNPVSSQAGTKVGYAEIVQLTRDYGNAAKAVNPAALTFGPVSYGWQGFVRLQDAPDANNRDFLNFFLQQMAQAQVTDGHRVLDVLDLHWYPEATGGGVRITADDSSAAVVAARKQAPRSLWDPTYTEKSWITDCCSGPSGSSLGSRTRSRRIIRARASPSPSTTTAQAATSPAASRRPMRSASSVARACSPPRTGACRTTMISSTARSRCSGITTARTAASATRASGRRTRTSPTHRCMRA
jgi:hypothetical protein